MKNLITLSLIALVIFSACEKDRLTANGNLNSETRNLGTFIGVHTSGSSPIHITYGNAYKVVVKGSSNLIPYFESSVVNGKLYLNYGHVNVKQDDIEVMVTMPLVNQISLSGSAKIDIAGNFPLLDFIDVSVSGSGDVSLTSNMESSRAHIDISGSGSVNFQRLSTARADISISGSGSTHLMVNEKLIASISGSGKIYYTGNPLVESHISGSGKVIKL